MPNAHYEVPIPDAVKQAAAKMVNDARAAMPPGWGATVLLYEYGPPGNPLMYISTSERADSLALIADWAAHMQRAAR